MCSSIFNGSFRQRHVNRVIMSDPPDMSSIMSSAKHDHGISGHGARKAKQLALDLPVRGGKRRGAGRKPKGERALVSHRARPGFEKPTAVHVTLRVADVIPSLRSSRRFAAICACFARSRGRFGVRLAEYTVLGNHLHLIVEADDSSSLSRGVQGLCIRVARALNAMLERHGRVFSDHFHSRLLRTPTELCGVIRYLRGNAAHHYGETGVDAFSSAAADAMGLLVRPVGWLLRVGWRRARNAIAPATFSPPA
jgi:REP element-mobilizing transposase RayT